MESTSISGQDKTCCICHEVVLKKLKPTERRFGIMERCNHAFCLSCISKWRVRPNVSQDDKRRCPACRSLSDFVVPSNCWCENEESKNKVISDFKSKLSSRSCKYYERGKCNFGEKCFFLHSEPEGTSGHKSLMKENPRDSCVNSKRPKPYDRDNFHSRPDGTAVRRKYYLKRDRRVNSKKKKYFDTDIDYRDMVNPDCYPLDKKVDTDCNRSENVECHDVVDDPLENSNSNEDSAMALNNLDESDNNNSDQEDMNSDEDVDSEISADEDDTTLGEVLNDPEAQNELSDDNPYEEVQKFVLKVRDHDPFEGLPEGWIEVGHNSGMPIYLHKKSRVCSVSKPYFLGPGSARKHDIPISAIPCLNYLKQMEEEEAEVKCENEESNTSENQCPVNTIVSGCQANDLQHETSKNQTNILEDLNDTTQIDNSSDASKVGQSISPPTKCHSLKDKKESLDCLAVREYCQKRFKFETVTVKQFKSWMDRRNYERQKKRRLRQRICLPDGTFLVACPLPPHGSESSSVGSNSRKDFVLNPSGKSPVCVLHEYVQHTLRVQPQYVYKELGLEAMPYSAVVLINEMEYGCGYGHSKKAAKTDAARNALKLLIPKLVETYFAQEEKDEVQETQDVSFFDQIEVEDPRVFELGVKAGQLNPYQVLLECTKRNYGLTVDTEVSSEMKNLACWKHEFKMKCGKYSASVICKNTKEGKHRCAQAILQLLHPQITSWGGLLRLYGKSSSKAVEKK